MDMRSYLRSGSYCPVTSPATFSFAKGRMLVNVARRKAVQADIFTEISDDIEISGHIAAGFILDRLRSLQGAKGESP
jgi:hypothetical protein